MESEPPALQTGANQVANHSLGDKHVENRGSETIQLMMLLGPLDLHSLTAILYWIQVRFTWSAWATSEGVKLSNPVEGVVPDKLSSKLICF